MLKKLLAVAAPADHMVDRSGNLQPRFPRHLATPLADLTKSTCIGTSLKVRRAVNEEVRKWEFDVYSLDTRNSAG
jgi:hypothetical protein